jgi:glycine/D-amino acid oxidase-like deaminating enzyme
MTQRAGTVIAGGGIRGSSTAYRLARAGITGVQILELIVVWCWPG